MRVQLQADATLQPGRQESLLKGSFTKVWQGLGNQKGLEQYLRHKGRAVTTLRGEGRIQGTDNPAGRELGE